MKLCCKIAPVRYWSSAIQMRNQSLTCTVIKMGAKSSRSVGNQRQPDLVVWWCVVWALYTDWGFFLKAAIWPEEAAAAENHRGCTPGRFLSMLLISTILNGENIIDLGQEEKKRWKSLNFQTNGDSRGCLLDRNWTALNRRKKTTTTKKNSRFPFYSRTSLPQTAPVKGKEE